MLYPGDAPVRMGCARAQEEILTFPAPGYGPKTRPGTLAAYAEQ
jgi:hypothetical protein